MADKIQLSDDDLFDIYNLHIMTKSYFGEMENAKQYFDKICELKITERDFMTAMFNYTSGLIQVKRWMMPCLYDEFQECLKGIQQS